ncbi:response regulator [Alphaproteobacteria bacterium]|nr:response regulator [Alphaproteobacteria bacterium]
MVFFKIKEYCLINKTNGSSGLSHLASNEFDICLLDVQVPKLNGYQIYNSALQQNVKTPIIFFTAEEQIKILPDDFAQMSVNYLLKPATFDVLLDKIHDVLTHREYELHNPNQIDYFISSTADSYLNLQDKIIQLTPAEFALFEAFSEAKNQSLTYFHMHRLLNDNAIKNHSKSIWKDLTSLSTKLENENIIISQKSGWRDNNKIKR